MTLEQVAQLIHPGTKTAKAGGSRLNIQCIAHEDRTPSLTIWHDVRGKLAFNCHAGCTHDQIVDRLPPEALDYARSTWGVEATVVQFPTTKHNPQPPQEVKPNGEIHYPYATEDGEIAYVVVRAPGKRIYQMHHQKGHLVNGRGSHPLIPYRLPDVIRANELGDTIYIVEGEKDADNLARLGFTATTNPGGAGKWTEELSAWLAGAHVVIIPDNDQPGREHALDVSLKLDQIAESVKIVHLPDLPDKGDISDWIEAGGTTEELEQIVREAQQDELDEWTPLNLGPIVDGDTEHLDPPPSVLERKDGTCLLYARELNWMSGEPESGKSWIAQVATAQELIKGHQVTYIDFEDTPGRIVKRFVGLGVPAKAIKTLLHYVRPSIASTDAQIARLCSEARSSSLAVIDGVTDLHIIHGKDPETNRDVAEIVQRILRPLADAGPAVLPIDHVTKNKETRSRYAIGGQHKLAAVRGASYGVEVRQPFGKGERGEAFLYIFKDRPGHIRGRHTLPVLSKHLAGVFVLDSSNGGEEYHINPPGYIEQARSFERYQMVQAFVREHPQSNVTAIREGIDGIGNDSVRGLLDEMEARGLLVNKGSANRPLYEIGESLVTIG